ncbi:MAG: hypothetical protein IIU35_01240 [Neisseriaceae bacterium]|nr:hypothetical protein [Neisseriaceae bacterium]
MSLRALRTQSPDYEERTYPKNGHAKTFSGSLKSIIEALSKNNPFCLTKQNEITAHY